MKINGHIEYSRPYPSPNKDVSLLEITYWSEDALVKGLLAIPKCEATEGILYLRGGIQSVGMVRPARIAEIACEGMVVFAPYYRGNRGGQGKDEFVGIDRYDAVNGVDVLKQFVKGAIHVFSFSRGGIMALWTGILRSDIASIVTWGGVSDLLLTYEERVDMRRMMKRVVGSPQKYPHIYEKRTPLHRIQEISCPVCIIHGKQDDHVSFEHATRLAAALERQQKHVETWFYEQYTHYFPMKINHEVVQKACEWMKKQK